MLGMLKKNEYKNLPTKAMHAYSNLYCISIVKGIQNMFQQTIQVVFYGFIINYSPSTTVTARDEMSFYSKIKIKKKF